MKTKFMWLVLYVGMIAAGVFSIRVVRAQDAPKRIEVTAKRFTYEPADITVKKGEPVVLVIKSADATHGLRFRDLDLNAKIDKGGSVELKFTPAETGDFIGHCSVFCGSGHGEMTLTLHVIN